jgi:Domain of unknown function (DUF4397)
MQYNKSSFRPLLLTAPLITTALFAAGCSDTSDDDGFSAGSSEIRVVHAVADAPLVNVYLDDDLVLDDVDFRDGTGFIEVAPGRYDVRVEAIVPGGNVDVIDAANVEFSRDERTTIYASGDTSDGTIAPLLVEDPTQAVAPGAVRAAVVHAAPNAPEVSVFVTAPNADLASSAPLGTFSFGETLGPVEVPAAEYQIRVTLGTGTTVVFDSGPITLAAGSDLQLAAVTSTVSGDSPISLVVLDGEGSADLFDTGTGADVRVVHNSPDAPAVDVVVNDDFGNPVVSGLTFSEFTPFLDPPVPAGDYNLKVVDTATQGFVALDFDATLEAGTAYTVIANDFVSNIEQLVLVDNNRRVATEAKLRIVHGSPSAGVVDIYLLEPGCLPEESCATAAFTDVPFGAETGFVGVSPGTYDVYVTPANVPETLAIAAPGVSVAASGIYTAIARDNTGGAGGVPLGLILLDDFAP